MPPNDDWILYGPFIDHSLIRNAVIYELARRTGEWAPRTAFLELFESEARVEDTPPGWPGEDELNYSGLYLLVEKIEEGGDRVDVPGGAIFEISSAQSDDTWGAFLAGEIQHLVTPSEYP